jgi:TonB family protein
MLPHPTSRSAPGTTTPPPPPLPLPDLALLLEQHVVAGFPPDLALDLVLNELVARAADATHATAAALALLRGKLMVCRAATGLHAPDLGVPLDTRDGLSGACARSHLPQVSDDTENDPRVDPAISRRLGIRSMLVVPVFAFKKTATERNPPLTGVLEVFSPFPNTFNQQSQILLSDFADECARIHNMAIQLQSRPRVAISQVDDDLILSDTALAKGGEERSTDLPGGEARTQNAATDEVETGDQGLAETADAVHAAGQSDTDIRAQLRGEELVSQGSEPEFLPSSAPAPVARQRNGLPRQPYEVWTLILGGLDILAAAAFSFMIGSRVGWLRSQQPALTIASAPQTGDAVEPGATGSPPIGATAKMSAHNKNSERTPALPQSKDSARTKAAAQGKSPGDELVVYEKGKVVFRMKPAPVESSAPSHARPAPSRQASSRQVSGAPPNSIWLAPTEAASRLITRTEPQYPADALAAHRSGNVTLEVQVAKDGTVSAVNPLSGDPKLAAAAAEAVRRWRYQPYRANDEPAQFQTDVTLTFSLPD